MSDKKTSTRQGKRVAAGKHRKSSARTRSKADGWTTSAQPRKSSGVLAPMNAVDIHSGDGRILGSVAEHPNVQQSYARPDNVTGRMKPTKFRKALRDMVYVAAEDPERTEVIKAGIQTDLEDARR